MSLAFLHQCFHPLELTVFKLEEDEAVVCKVELIQNKRKISSKERWITFTSPPWLVEVDALQMRVWKEEGKDNKPLKVPTTKVVEKSETLDPHYDKFDILGWAS